MRHIFIWSFMILFMLLGCKGKDQQTPKSSLTIKLTDAPFSLDVLESAIVNISRIDMNHNGKFINLITKQMTYDLLKLRGGVTETLTQVEIPEEEISQLRLFVGSQERVKMVSSP